PGQRLEARDGAAQQRPYRQPQQNYVGQQDHHAACVVQPLADVEAAHRRRRSGRASPSGSPPATPTRGQAGIRGPSAPRRRSRPRRPRRTPTGSTRSGSPPSRRTPAWPTGRALPPRASGDSDRSPRPPAARKTRASPPARRPRARAPVSPPRRPSSNRRRRAPAPVRGPPVPVPCGVRLLLSPFHNHATQRSAADFGFAGSMRDEIRRGDAETRRETRRRPKKEKKRGDSGENSVA